MCDGENTNINIGDLVVFKYEQKKPAKVGLVLKKEVRAMPRYGMGPYGGDGAFADPLLTEIMSCYCLWTASNRKWWVPVTNITLIKGDSKNA
jgi:hypothetical protein